MKKRARIIYNPTSGRELFKKQLPDCLIQLEQAGYITSAHATTAEGDATLAAQYAAEDGFDLVIAAGGDGTVNEVINGIADFEVKPKLGIIPMGTVNDYGKALGIKKNIQQAIDVITNNTPTKLDIGKMNNRYFMNIAGGGKITEVSYEAPSRLKTLLGPVAYYVKGIEMLPNLSAIDMRLEYDDEVYEGKVMLFLLGLTNSIGGFDKIAPDSEFDDGYFSFMFLEEVSLAELAHIITLTTRGEHIQHPKVHYKKAREVRVTSGETVQLNIDGEFGGNAPAHFVNLKQHIEVFTNIEGHVDTNVEEQEELLDME